MFIIPLLATQAQLYKRNKEIFLSIIINEMHEIEEEQSSDDLVGSGLSFNDPGCKLKMVSACWYKCGNERGSNLPEWYVQNMNTEFKEGDSTGQRRFFETLERVVLMQYVSNSLFDEFASCDMAPSHKLLKLVKERIANL